MQRIYLLAVGKTSFEYVKKAEPEWVKRIGRFANFTYLVAKDSKGDSENQKTKEGKELLRLIPETAMVVLLDEKGEQFSSKKFATWLQSTQMSGRPVYFVIGGANGFSQEMYARSNALLSLSPMTFSHQLIRLIFLEQLYRGLSIIAGHPYHNE
jgi:23S rRNA (pseudouridine1915-N3)-methyltransferase